MSDEVAAEAVETPVSEEIIEEGMPAEATAEPSESPETVEELQDAVDQAIEDGATEEEVKDMIREFEIKVGGKTKKVKVDLSDEEAIKREIQMAHAGRLAMQEKAELEKFFNSEVNRIKQNPWEVMKELGLDPEQLNEDYINERIEQMKKSPEQIERENMQRELDKLRQEMTKREQEAKQAQMEQLYMQAQSELDDQITSALMKEPTLPKTKKTVARIADALNWAIDKGHVDVTVEEVIPFVKADLQREFNEFFSEMPEEVIEEMIGKSNMERLRQKRLAAAKKAKAASSVKTSTVSSVIANKLKEEHNAMNPKQKTVRSKDFFRNLK